MPSPSAIPDIPGVKAEHKTAQKLSSKVAGLLGMEGRVGFPAAQPVSFTAKHIQELKRTDYYLSEKSDGTRCLIYCTHDDADNNREIHYLINRRNEYYIAENLHFPMPNDPSFQSFHTETLIDGELVLDDVGGGKVLMRYMVFDCLVLEGENMLGKTLDMRIACFKDKILTPYKELWKTRAGEVKDLPFELELTRMEASYSIKTMFNDVLPNLSHSNDGLVFTCRSSTYKLYDADEKILKWKPASENSIDFRLNLEFPPASNVNKVDNITSTTTTTKNGRSLTLDYQSMPIFHLSIFLGNHQNPNYQKWSTMYVTVSEWEGFKALGQPLDGNIVECVMDGMKRWKFKRFRRDKDHANNLKTVKGITESIEDAVGREYLIMAAEGIKDAWMARNSRQSS